MSKLNTNGFFKAVRKQKDAEKAKNILREAKLRQDGWWKLYKAGLVKYENK